MTPQGHFYAEYEGEKMGISLHCEATALSQVSQCARRVEGTNLPSLDDCVP